MGRSRAVPRIMQGGEGKPASSRCVLGYHVCWIIPSISWLIWGLYLSPQPTTHNTNNTQHNTTQHNTQQAVEQDLDWVVPMDVQDEAIPLILGGGDVMVAAGTVCLPTNTNYVFASNI